MRENVEYYALVICNPGSAEDSRRNERGFGQSFATAVRGKYSGFALYWQKWLSRKSKESRLRGKTAVVLPTSRGFAGPKVKVPAIPRGSGEGGGGAWLQMTSVLPLSE